MPYHKPLLLIICDGMGNSTKTEFNAVFNAHMPNFNHYWKTYPHTTLAASGTAVGLPEMMVGNSEVGHLTIGTGRVTTQPITKLLQAIQDGSFFANQTLIHNLKNLCDHHGSLHIISLLSDAGIHSHSALLYAAIQAAQENHIKNIYVHAFLDGRDTPPQSADRYLQKLDCTLKNNDSVKLASITGRFYGMDRDKHWDRTEKSYAILTEPQPASFSSWETALSYYYDRGITDEFIPPTQLLANGIIKPHDGIFFLNIRPDRARQLTLAFLDRSFDAFKRTFMPLSCFITPTVYGKTTPTDAMITENTCPNALADILLEHHKTIYAIAETEKYAHISYFFNGGRETKKTGETQVLIPSLNLKTYDVQPCMSAPAITDALIDSLAKDPKDFYLINYANPDMVGHSGNYTATIKALECLDTELGKLYHHVIECMQGAMIITADHGNAEDMFNQNIGQPNKAHTANPVPFVFITSTSSISAHVQKLSSLADIAPFILTYYGIPIPPEMR